MGGMRKGWRMIEEGLKPSMSFIGSSSPSLRLAGSGFVHVSSSVCPVVRRFVFVQFIGYLICILCITRKAGYIKLSHVSLTSSWFPFHLALASLEKAGAASDIVAPDGVVSL